MSPVSSSKCSDPGARVHAPFVSSNTWTCSGALYWETHVTNRSPWATGRVSVTVTDETRDPVANAAPWTKVGVDWATVARARRTPRMAVTARRGPGWAEGKSFMVIHSFTRARMRTSWKSGRLRVGPSGRV